MTPPRVVRVPGCLVLAALLLFMGLPLAELALLLWSASAIGFWWTLLACVATGVAGTLISRWQGTAVMRAFQQSMASGMVPTDAMLDGAFVLVGGVMLLVPGFVSDFIGLWFLLPPTRALLKRGLRRWWQRQQGVVDVSSTVVQEPPDATLP